MKRLPLLVPALVALALTGCEDSRTVSDLPGLRDAEAPNSDLRDTPRLRARGPRLAPEHDRSAAAILSDLLRLYPDDLTERTEEFQTPETVDPGLVASVRKFVGRLVEAADRRDPAVCRRFFMSSHRHKLNQTSTRPHESATIGCIRDLQSSKGRVRLLGITQIFFKGRHGTAGVIFTTQTDRAKKSHGLRLIRNRGGWRVASGATNITVG